MADFQYQRPPLGRERYINTIIFNVVQVDLGRQAAPSKFAIFNFTVTTLLALIQITFPATGTLSFSFQTHTKFMLAMLSLLAFCCFAIASTQNLFPNHAAKLVTAIKCSTASLLVASLVSLLLHKPWDQVPYITYVLYFTGHFLCLIINIILPAYYRYVARGPVRRSRARRRQQLRNTPPLLPVTLSSLPNISDHPNVNRGSITVVRTVH